MRNRDSSDIVVRLQGPNPPHPREAAAQIKRLRAALESLGEVANQCVGPWIGRLCRYCDCGGARMETPAEKPAEPPPGDRA